MKTRIIIASVFALLLGTLTIINIPKSKAPLKNDTTAITIETTNTTTTTKKVVKTTKKVVKTTQKTTTKTVTYKITHYGWNCKGCSGTTASGYNVKNTIYYNDATYGRLRIVAMKNLPLYSVIRIKNYKLGETYAIVLDRGVGSGVIDLLVENESKASELGIQKNVEIEILRSGK